jgi:arylformamidase
MQTYDISLTISPSLPVWPGDPRIEFERTSEIEKGDQANVTRMNMGVHTGTHVDAPFHFLGGETPTVEELSLRTLTGRAYVLHLPDEVDAIDRKILELMEIPPRTRRLLFRTRNSKSWADKAHPFNKDFVAITADGAEFLVEHSIKLVGVDYLSVAPFDVPRPTHEILLRAGTVIVEGLDLSQVSQGRYTLYCLPLKLAGCDGAPARAILIGI